PALDPEPLKLTPELMRRIPAKILRVGVPGETLADVLPRLRRRFPRSPTSSSCRRSRRRCR
ncbi:MAG: hypothetical protein ACJ76L_06305, partial [Conexibacter sp.]